jgi:peptidoglycan/LPS O-acetylase OafA/YrhL
MIQEAAYTPEHTPDRPLAIVDRGGSPPSQVRFEAIDGLRGLASLMVVLGHVYEGDGSPYQDHLLSTILFFAGGVDLFFVISGFCLFYPLTKPGAVPRWATFYRRRARRLLLPYYAAMVFVILSPLLVEPLMARLGIAVTPVGWPDWRQLWTHAVFLHTLFPDTYFSFNGPLWSLAIEWQFYLAFPLAVLLVRYLGWRGVALIGLLTVSYRIVINDSALGANTWPIDVVHLFPSHWLEFALGMLVALRLRAFGERRISRWREIGDIAGIVWLYIVASYVLYGPALQYPYPVKDLLYGAIWAPIVWLACVEHTITWRLFSNRVLVWLGIRSYSIYLIHLPMLFGLGNTVSRMHLGEPQSLIVMAALGVPLVLATGAVFFELFERPVLRPAAAGRRVTPLQSARLVEQQAGS